MQLEYQCCFCGQEIAEADAGGQALDPCAVIVVGNWKSSAEEQVEQQWFCHHDCFKGLVEKHVPVELEELASETV